MTLSWTLNYTKQCAKSWFVLPAAEGMLDEVLDWPEFNIHQSARHQDIFYRAVQKLQQRQS